MECLEFNSNYGQNSKLISLRAQLPFLPIIPLPSQVKTVVFPTATNDVVEVFLPDSCRLITFTYNDIDIAVSLTATPKDYANTSVYTTATVVNEGDLINPDTSIFYYVEGVRSIRIRHLSAASVAVGFLSINCFVQL